MKTTSKFHKPRDKNTTYADYIATRPRAEMLGFDTGERWRNRVRANRDELAKNFKIRPSSLQWYGAFHNESYHPHIHLFIYDKENRGYLDKEGIEKIKSTFAHSIFRDEMLNLQNEKTDRRDKLRLKGKDEIEEIIKRISSGQENNLMLQALLVDLQRRLQEHKGKKVYGYLSKDDKHLVDRIVDEIEKIPAVKELYDLWYEKQEELHRIYSESLPARVPLSENPEFKSIRSAVIAAVADMNVPKEVTYSMEDDIIGIDLSDGEGRDTNPDRTQNQEDDKTRSDHGSHHVDSNAYVTGMTIRLLNNVSKIFRDKFDDNPKHVPKVDLKLRRKIIEKDEAHGIRHS